jgi:hypothetical protein
MQIIQFIVAEKSLARYSKKCGVLEFGVCTAYWCMVPWNEFAALKCDESFDAAGQNFTIAMSKIILLSLMSNFGVM